MSRLFRVSLVLFIIGVAMTVIFSSMSDYKVFSTVDEEDFVYYEETYDGDAFTNLSFDFINRNFDIKPSNNDEIKITYYLTDLDQIDITDDQDTLEIHNNIEWYNQIFTGWFFFVSREFYMVTVYLPTSYEYHLDVQTTNGDIDATNIGQMTSIDIDTSNGTINLSQMNANSIDLHTSNGSIYLDDVSCTSKINAHTSNGRLNFTDVSADEIDASTSNGKIIALNIESNDIEMDTSNGSIELDIIGNVDDYEVYMDTSNGDMIYNGIKVLQEHLNPEGDLSINLDTSNGDITLTFND